MDDDWGSPWADELDHKPKFPKQATSVQNPELNGNHNLHHREELYQSIPWGDDEVSPARPDASSIRFDTSGAQYLEASRPSKSGQVEVSNGGNLGQTWHEGFPGEGNSEPTGILSGWEDSGQWHSQQDLTGGAHSRSTPARQSFEPSSELPAEDAPMAVEHNSGSDDSGRELNDKQGYIPTSVAVTNSQGPEPIKSSRTALESGPIKSANDFVVEDSSSRPSTSLSDQSHTEKPADSPRTSFEEDPAANEAVSSQTNIQGLIPSATQGDSQTEALSTVDKERKEEGNAQDEDEDEDDFGDFEEEAAAADQGDHEQRPTEPQAISRGDDAHFEESNFVPQLPYEPDQALIDALFPRESAVPSLAEVGEENISTISSRKTWYRISRNQTKREHDCGEGNYVRVIWPGSRVQAEVNKVISRWIVEDRIAGGVALGGSNTLGSVFGWAHHGHSPSTETAKSHLSGLKKSSHAVHGLSKHHHAQSLGSPDSMRPIRGLPVLPKPSESPGASAATTAPFDWSSGPGALKVGKHHSSDLHRTSLETHTSARSAGSSPSSPASAADALPEPLNTASMKFPVDKRLKSLHKSSKSLDPSLLSLSRSPSQDANKRDSSPATLPIATFRAADDHGLLPPQTEYQSNPTKPKLEAEQEDPWAALGQLESKPNQIDSNESASPIDLSTPVSSPKEKRKALSLDVKSITTTTKPHDDNDADDDEWGDMVESPAVSTPPTFPISSSSHGTSSSLPPASPHQSPALASSPASSQISTPRLSFDSILVPAKPAARNGPPPRGHSRNFSCQPSFPSASPLGMSKHPLARATSVVRSSSPLAMAEPLSATATTATTPIATTSQRSSSNPTFLPQASVSKRRPISLISPPGAWDEANSFFDSLSTRSAHTSGPKPPPEPVFPVTAPAVVPAKPFARKMSPPLPTPPKQVSLSPVSVSGYNDDDIVKRIVTGLPDLRYMLRR
ncbi:MAG: hypothetical protein M1819_006061 [Sarea resinae]|nr:MAG: hypothetical protein M1819_006061 [Sarea resinae]